MSSIDDFKALAIKEQFEIILNENAMLKMRIQELENSEIISNEELICMKQIGILKASSDMRDLTLDEVKRLDLLVKNLKIIREKPSVDLEEDIRDVREADLVAIATANQTE
jgi:hypothetical protein